MAVITKTTRKDVAKLANVSVATVSYVLNNSVPVKEETKERVLSAAKKLGYTPNLLARSLSTKRTYQIGIILDNIRNQFYNEIATGFEKIAAEHGYTVNIISQYQELKSGVEYFISHCFDGVLILGIPEKIEEEDLLRLADNGISVLIGGRFSINSKRISYLEHDFLQGMQSIANFLCSKGHHNIGYMSSIIEEDSRDNRLSSLRTACLEKGLQLNVVYDTLPDGTSFEGGYRMSSLLLKSYPNCTAIVAFNDNVAIGALKRLRELNISVPEDISLIGIDNIPYSNYTAPLLTTLSLNLEQYAEKAFFMLKASLDGKPAQYSKIQYHIVERESVRDLK